MIESNPKKEAHFQAKGKMCHIKAYIAKNRGCIIGNNMVVYSCSGGQSPDNGKPRIGGAGRSKK